MNIILSGAGGHMGRVVAGLTQNSDTAILAGVDPALNLSENDLSFPCVNSFEEVEGSVISERPVVVDFSHHAATKALTEFAVKNSLPLVIATTGQTGEEKELISEASKTVPVFFASNFSMGIALLVELAKKTALAMPDAEIEIVEVHHDRKVDAPSGTALTIARALKDVRPGSEIVTGRSGQEKRKQSDIGVSAVRYGNIVGIHEVIIATQSQTITLKHEAHSRALFAEGALSAVKFIKDKPAGLYDMTDMVGD